MANHHAYTLRSGTSRNYRQLASIKLPRARKSSSEDRLYPIEVVETVGSRARIHYIGYDNSSDEWRELTELVEVSPTTNIRPTITPYSLYNELKIKIKQSLVCGRKQSPLVVIDMGFDYLLFKGGLQTAGTIKKTVRGNQVYHLKSYQELDPLLGENWHYRGINKNGDYAFVVLNTIEYYIHKRRKITEYHPSKSGDNVPVTQTPVQDAGYVLKFRFVRGYGNISTFGKDKRIFK